MVNTPEHTYIHVSSWNNKSKTLSPRVHFALLWRRWHQHVCAMARASAIKQMLCNVMAFTFARSFHLKTRRARNLCGCQRRVHLRAGRIVAPCKFSETRDCCGSLRNAEANDFFAPRQLVSPIISQGWRTLFFFYTLASEESTVTSIGEFKYQIM